MPEQALESKTDGEAAQPFSIAVVQTAKPLADYASRKLLAGPVLGVVLTLANQIPPWGLVVIVSVYIVVQGSVDLVKELHD